MPLYDAIEINSPKVADILKALHPALKKFHYEDLHLNFFIVDYPEPGEHTLFEATEMKHWPMITPGIKIKTVQLHNK